MALLEELGQTLEQVLPAASAAGYRLAARSATRLGDADAPQPHWLALRRARIGWRCRLIKEGRKIRFLFITVGRQSARERIDGEVTIELQPVPEAEAAALAAAVPPAQVVELPQSYGVSEDGTLEFRFGSKQPFAVNLDDPNFDLHDKKAVKHIQLVSWPGGGWQGPGPVVRWPLEAFVSFAFELAHEPVVGGGPTLPLAPAPDSAAAGKHISLRDFVAELAGTLRSAPGLVAAGDPPAAYRTLLPLPMNWRLVAGGARLGVLIDKKGQLASPDDDDTFLAPCDLKLIRGTEHYQLIPAAGWPDFVLRGPVRAAALEAFKEDGAWADAAKTEPLAKWGCTKGMLLDWVEDDDRAVFLRTDRRASNDEVLLMLRGRLHETDVVVLMHADKVAYKIDKETGEMTAKAKNFTVVQAGPRSETMMVWDTKKGGGKQLFCDVLHGFLRWHAALRPLLVA